MYDTPDPAAQAPGGMDPALAQLSIAPFVATQRGWDELKRGDTALQPLELELLVRLDGTRVLSAIWAGMRHVPQAQFVEVFRSLRDAQLVEAAQADPVGAKLRADLVRLGGGVAAEADAQLKALRADGFFVGIARRRTGGRPPAHEGALRALVVEDEPVLARFVRSYLSLEGIEARVAANREQVLAELRKAPAPDVILLDVHLPDVDGFTILDKLRAHPVYRQVPVIMLTGEANRASVIRGITAGADGYMTKPFEADALVRAVRTVLGLADETAAAAADPWVNGDCVAAPVRHGKAAPVAQGWTLQ